MHTHHKGIVTHWTQPLTGGKYIRVFVWEDSKSLENAAWDDDARKYHEKKDAHLHGRCDAQWYWNNEGRRLSGKKFGDIHLVQGAIGSGLVAHELQHLTVSWIGFRNWNLEIDNERIALFMEKITKRFWIEFYKRFK